MSQVIKCTVDPKVLEPIVDEWLSEVNTDRFGISIDKNKAIDDLRQMTFGEDADLFLLVVQDKVVGFSGVIIYENRLTDHKIANEHYLYILPKYRKGKNPLKLIRAVEKWSEEKGCSHILMNASNMASDKHDKLCRVYGRLGYKLFESSYIKECA